MGRLSPISNILQDLENQANGFKHHHHRLSNNLLLKSNHHRMILNNLKMICNLKMTSKLRMISNHHHQAPAQEDCCKVLEAQRISVHSDALLE